MLYLSFNIDATTTDLPPGVLYRVKATYGYVKEDVDELSFEVGDIIRVIEYDDPEDQVKILCYFNVNSKCVIVLSLIKQKYAVCVAFF